MRVLLVLVLIAGWAFGQIVPGRYVMELSGDAAALGATVLGSMDTVANALLVPVPDSRAAAPVPA